MVYQEQYQDPQKALKREKQIKQWSGKKKLALIKGDICELQSLSRSKITFTKEPFDKLRAPLDSHQNKMACHERAKRVEWRWYKPIRTALELPFNFRVYLGETHKYQVLGDKAKVLRDKGLSWVKI